MQTTPNHYDPETMALASVYRLLLAKAREAKAKKEAAAVNANAVESAGNLPEAIHNQATGAQP